jgi:uncharacterized protein (TIGR02594 family)
MLILERKLLVLERKLLVVCSVALSVFAGSALADTGSTENATLETPRVSQQAKAGRLAVAPRKARGRTARIQVLQPQPTQNGRREEDVESGAPAQSQSASAMAAAPAASSSVVAEARRYMGTNPTKRRSLWCGAFMNMVLERTGHKRGPSDLAKSFASYGQRIPGPQVGALAIMSRGRGGGHVGVVSGIDPSGNVIVVSGNHNNRVAESVYPRGRILAYVMPSGA